MPRTLLVTSAIHVPEAPRKKKATNKPIKLTKLGIYVAAKVSA
jgi:hypothetical protein